MDKTTIRTPEKTNLVPISYDDALALYNSNGRRPFSFMAAPYDVLKTITVERGNILATHPDAARAHYDWLATNRRLTNFGTARSRARRSR